MNFQSINIAVQKRVIFATMWLHNFLRPNKIKDFDFEEADKETDDGSHGQQNVSADANDDQSFIVEEETEAENYMN